jgi:nitrogen fixation NifU-like protein
MYSPQVLDHFEHPRNVGELENADAAVQMENPACGDILKLSLRVENGRVSQVRFKAKGCVAAMACGSQISELARGKTLQEAQNLKRGDLLTALGGLPEASAHASALAIDALRAALAKIKL